LDVTRLPFFSASHSFDTRLSEDEKVSRCSIVRGKNSIEHHAPSDQKEECWAQVQGQAPLARGADHETPAHKHGDCCKVGIPLTQNECFHTLGQAFNAMARESLEVRWSIMDPEQEWGRPDQDTAGPGHANHLGESSPWRRYVLKDLHTQDSIETVVRQAGKIFHAKHEIRITARVIVDRSACHSMVLYERPDFATRSDREYSLALREAVRGNRLA
jgi:hypothetical protein